VPTSNSRGRSHPEAWITKSDVVTFEKVVGQIISLRDDFSVQAKSKPDNLLNLFKLEFVNEKLAEANKILTGDHKPFKSFEQFDPDKLPSNSDVQLVLSQYLACLERWRSAHVYYDSASYKWFWRVQDDKINADAATRPPSIEDKKR
jgi:hypothetical protein